jgi:hypothetical protein
MSWQEVEQLRENCIYDESQLKHQFLLYFFRTLIATAPRDLSLSFSYFCGAGLSLSPPLHAGFALQRKLPQRKAATINLACAQKSNETRFSGVICEGYALSYRGISIQNALCRIQRR